MTILLEIFTFSSSFSRNIVITVYGYFCSKSNFKIFIFKVLWFLPMDIFRSKSILVIVFSRCTCCCVTRLGRCTLTFSSSRELCCVICTSFIGETPGRFSSTSPWRPWQLTASTDERQREDYRIMRYDGRLLTVELEINLCGLFRRTFPSGSVRCYESRKYCTLYIRYYSCH